MADDDYNDISKRRTPPESEEEWAYLFDGSNKGHLIWEIIGPFVQVARNWKWWITLGFILAYVNFPGIAQIIRSIFEGMP